MKKYPFLIHIPHASLRLPKLFYQHTLLSRKEILIENKKMADYQVDRLIDKSQFYTVLFPYSRLFCDVERFTDIDQEPMEQHGMGVIYEKTSRNKSLLLPTCLYREWVLENYYYPFHQKLQKTADKIIKKYQQCLLIDFHSFSDIVVEELFSIHNTPDICIGTDTIYTPSYLIDFTISFFKQYNYSVALDYPYQGTMIPDDYLHHLQPHFTSIMLEINRRIYEKENDFKKLQNVLQQYFNQLEQIINKKDIL